MKFLSLLLAIVTINLSGTTFGGVSPDVRDDSGVRAKDKLAVIVQRDKDAKFDSGKLQSLVEVEFFKNWQGDFLERKDLDVLLKEMKLSAVLSGPSTGVKIGELLHVDYFVLVTVKKDKVVCVVNRFPEATVVSETVYQGQFFEESIAKRITVHSLKAINEYKLDKTKVRVSIGSFIYKDPFRKYLSVSDTIHDDLRKRLPKHPKVTLTERLFPSHLLKEYSLAMSSLSKSVNASLCAPPADILVFGKFVPQKIQNLKSGESVLDFEISFISPTGLFTKVVLLFSVSSKNIQSAGLQIENGLARIVSKVEDALINRTERRYNDAEYKTFKQQALNLIPSVYSTVLHGTTTELPDDIRHEYEKGIRAIENALMFKSDDAELMLEAGLLLGRMVNKKARTLYHKRDDPAYRDEYQRVKAISVASLDYIENAYLMNANSKIRSAYVNTVGVGYKNILSARISRMMRHVLDSRPGGGWSDHHIGAAISTLISKSDDIDKRTKLFLDFASNKKPGFKPSLYQMGMAYGYTIGTIDRNKDPEEMKKAIDFANKLVGNGSPAIAAMGHCLRARIYRYFEGNYKASLAEISVIIDLIPDIYEEFGREYYRSSIPRYVSHNLFYEKGNTIDEKYPVVLKYATAQLQVKHYSDTGIKMSLRIVLPELYKRREYKKGYDLVSELLANHTNDGNDHGYGYYVSWKNKFKFKLSKIPQLKLKDFVSIDMSKADKAHGRMRIYKLVYAFGQIWGVNCHIYINGQFGQLFNLSVNSTKPKFHEFDEIISDFDCSSNYIGVAKINGGVSFLDDKGKLSKNFTRQNSMLPSNIVRVLCSDGETFYLGLFGKNISQLGVHQINPKKDTIKNCQHRISTTNSIRWFNGKVTQQNFRHRTRSDGPNDLEFKRRGNSSTVIDHDNNNLLSYEGADLSCVYDFLLWQGFLVFADESGLYITKPKSNKIRCVFSEEGLSIYSLCAVDKQLFIGTSNGLFRIDHKTFKGVIKDDATNDNSTK